MISCSTRLTPAFIIAALLGMAVPSAYAQTDVTGTMTGADGANGTLGTDPAPTTDTGNAGQVGDNLFSDPSYHVHDATFTGGNGGDITGQGGFQSRAGMGGEGLAVFGGTTATVDSGTFTGGTGGPASGTDDNSANSFLHGGYGGNALEAGAARVTVNGGTFQGGASGTATSDGAHDTRSEFGGAGVIVGDSNSVVTINGGNFTGGNGADVTDTNPTPDGNGGNGGSGLLIFNGTTTITGGVFTGGAGGNFLDGNGNVISTNSGGSGIFTFGGTTTLIGTGFTVNGNPFSGPITSGSGTISGFLKNNDQTAPTTITYLVLGGVLNIGAAPEPSPWAGLGIGLLGLAGLALKARRRTAA